MNYLIVVIKLVSSICDNCGSIAEKIFKEVESIEILKFPGLIENIQLFHKYYWRKHKSQTQVGKYI